MQRVIIPAALLVLCVFLTSAVALAQQCNTYHLDNQTEVNAFPSSCTSILGSLYIRGGLISDLSRLSNLTSISKELVIEDTSLPNLDGLSGLTYVGELVGIATNDDLTNVDGLSGLASAGHLEAAFSFDGNRALTNLDGLTGLTSIGSGLVVRGHRSLTDLSGLSALTSIGGPMTIARNFLLKTFDAVGLPSGVYFYRLQAGDYVETRRMVLLR